MLSLGLAALGFFASQATASPIVQRDAPGFHYDGDAPFTVDDATLQAAFTCPNGNPTADSPPVLLIHGTTTTGDETWGKGYVPALLADGYTACYVTMPNRMMGDAQVSAEYVAYGIHYLHSLTGMKASLISHSQGGPVTQWALEYFPSTVQAVQYFIPLTPDFMGIELLGSNFSRFCVDDLCQASLWQQSKGSHFYDALHRRDFNARIPTTAIWTEFDGVVNPPEFNAQLPGANVVLMQDLCNLRPTNHIFITIDAAAYAIALDALRNGGVASLDRIRDEQDVHDICSHIEAPNMDLGVAEEITDLFKEFEEGFITGMPRVKEEPPVMAYAQ